MKKYKLVNSTLILKDQNYKRIVPKSQYYPLTSLAQRLITRDYRELFTLGS